MTEGLVLDVSVAGLEETAASVDAYPQFVSQELNTAMSAALDHLEAEIAKRTPTNIGNLRSSIQGHILTPFPNLTGVVTTPKLYGIVIEKGRKAGANMPPVDAIQLWAVRKLGLSPDEAEGAAWAIAKSIAKHGFSDEHAVGREGAKMFEKGLEAAEPHINQLFNEAIARSVARFNAS